ncbi:PAS domain S-box protein [Mangrovibacterium diazotrophicum]|nr:PAS domain S-box protein [Mangrovibacterium diazotrophicum]
MKTREFEIDLLKKEIDKYKARVAKLEQQADRLNSSPTNTEPVMEATESFTSLYWADFTVMYQELKKLEDAGIADLDRYLLEFPAKIEGLLKTVCLTPWNKTKKLQAENLAYFYNPILTAELIALMVHLQQEGEVLSTKVFSQTCANELWQIELNADLNGQRATGLQYIRVVVTDLNAHLEEKQAVAEGRQHLSRLLKNLQGFVYRCRYDDDYSTLFITDSAYDVTGFSANEFLYDPTVSFAKIIHPDDVAYVRSTVEKSLKKSTKFYLEYRILTKEKQVKWVGEHCIGILDERGEVVAFEGSVLDITQRKQSDISLQETEERFHNVFELSPTAIILTDLHSGIILAANEAFERITGWDKASYAGKSKEDLDVWHNPGDRVVFMKELQARGRVENHEYKLVTRSGAVRVILMSASLLKEHNRTLVMSVWTDITAQKEVAEGFKKERNFLDRIIETIPESVWIKDNNGVYINCNRHLEQYFGVRKEDVIGKTDYDFARLSLAREFRMKDMAAVKSGKPIRHQDWIIHPADGRNILWETIKSPMYDSEGNLIGLLGVSRDITEMKNVEQELIRAKNLAEEASRLKSAFLATMSHELRTPLNAIIGFSGLIDEEMPKEQIIELVGIVNDSGNHLLSIIEDIFEIALLQSKGANVEREEFSLLSLCDSMKYYLEAEIIKSEKGNLNFNVQEPDQDRKLRLYTDKNKVLQILSNLVSNAVKYSDEGLVSMTFRIEEQDIVFCVADQGIGIAEEKQKFIFERFRQADESHTREYGGVGLGLAICKEVAELLDSEIWVESELGEGAKFFFRMPGVVLKN